MPEPNPALVVAAAVRTAMAESGNGGAPPQVPKLSAEEVGIGTGIGKFVKTFTLGRGGKGTTPYW